MVNMSRKLLSGENVKTIVRVRYREVVKLFILLDTLVIFEGENERETRQGEQNIK